MRSQLFLPRLLDSILAKDALARLISFQDEVWSDRLGHGHQHNVAASTGAGAS